MTRPFATAQRSSKVRDRDELRGHHWRRVVVPAVFRTYGWTCHLCGKSIDHTLKAPHPMSKSVDHIRGAATGFDMRYLRPAHLGCNLRQGDPTKTGDPKPVGATRW